MLKKVRSSHRSAVAGHTFDLMWVGALLVTVFVAYATLQNFHNREDALTQRIARLELQHQVDVARIESCRDAVKAADDLRESWAYWGQAALPDGSKPTQRVSIGRLSDRASAVNLANEVYDGTRSNCLPAR